VNSTYWAPIAAGEGMSQRSTLRSARTDAAVRDAYEASRPDGPRSFANIAWACRVSFPKQDGPA
jgi:hypothetical protein